VRFQESADLLPHTATGTIHWVLNSILPKVSGKVVWRFDQWSVRAGLSLKGTGSYYISRFFAVVNGCAERVHGQVAFRYENSGVAFGVGMHWRRAAVGLLWRDREAVVSTRVALCQRAKIGFRTAIRGQQVLGGMLRSTAIGFALTTDYGLWKFAVQGKARVATAKWKTAIELGELATFLVADEFGLGKWRMGISLCMKPELLQGFKDGAKSSPT
jgi:hypothetical protein